MLWKIEETNLHIIGSVHVSNRPLVLSPLSISSINNAAILAFEANFDCTPICKKIRYGKKSALSKNISSSLFSSAAQLWDKVGLPAEDLEDLQPWFVAFSLMNALMLKNGFLSANGIDQRVLNVAKENRKKLFFLESPDAGLAPFAEASQSEQEKFLNKVVFEPDEGIRDVASLIDAWESSDLLLFQSIAEKALKLMPIAYSNALAGRNKAWLPQIMRLAKSQRNVVVVVGALHMVCRENIPDLLATEGLKCSKV